MDVTGIQMTEVPITGAPISIEASSATNEAIVTVSGRIDAVEAPELREEFDRVLAGVIEAGRTGILVDLSRVVFIDSAGLAALVRLRRGCLASSIMLTLVRPVSEDAMRVFRLTRFDEVFTMRTGESP